MSTKGRGCEQALLDNPRATAHPRFDFIMKKAPFRILIVAVGLCLSLSHSCFGLDDATNTASGTAAGTADSSAGSEESLRAYLQLQEQIHEALLAIERNRQQSEDASARTSKVLTERLETIEQSLNAQRTNELDAVQHANRTMVIMVSSFAALGCLAVLLTAYFQWRAVNRFTSLSSALSVQNGLGPFRTMAALEAGENSLTTLGTAEQSGVRLLAAIERLEKRIQELERVSHPSLNDPAAANNILDLQPADGTPAPVSGDAGVAASSPTAALLARGQSFLNQGKLDEAIVSFDEVLASDPRNTEALVKKGTALERLRKSKEALECYDRAIAADSSMTIAYLYKGGLYNRMERFSEALACYEQALHTQEKRRAS
jgi:tetratricopeptide (TPR) repeat protein